MPEQAALQGESVERIRDIIFGPKMRDYEQRFDALVRDLNRMQAELDRLVEQATTRDATQTKNLQALRQELRQANTELRTELKSEAARLTTQMAEQHAAHTNAMNAARQELHQADDNLQAGFKADIEQVNCTMAEHEAAQKTTLQALRQELRKADADILEELRQIMQRLTDDKTDRSTLGELFIELGNHIKSGGNLADLLQSLDQPG